jgi:hypothetical protein
MENEILFKESQRFKQWWIWLILIGVNGLFVVGIIMQVFLEQQFGNNPMSNTALIILTGVFLLFTILMLRFKLETIIKQDGIYVRFFPFHIQFKHYKWDDLTKVYVRHYSPLKEYGGWGIRIGLSGKGTAFNISGNKGLQLEMVNNKKLLIGTNKPEQLTETLTKMGQIKAE